MSLTCKCCGEVVCKFMQAATDQPKTLEEMSPEELLAMIDGLNGNHCWNPVIVEALRTALAQRDEARSAIFMAHRFDERGNHLHDCRLCQIASRIPPE